MSKMSLSVQPANRRPLGSLELIGRADRAIAEAIEVADAVRLVASARALEEWAKAVRAGVEHERQAAAFVVKAKRNAGERLAAAQARGEVATPGQPRNVVGPDISSPATLAEIGITRDQSSEWKKLAAEWTPEALDAALEEMEKPSVAGIAARSPGMFTSDTPEWYTPGHIIEAVVAVLGTIDLDPCSDPGRTIPASKHYTVDDDGLAQGWRGKVYMNPPYGREIVAWVEKLAEEVTYGNVSEAVALVPARVDTTWWRRLPFVEWAALTGRLAFSGYENSAPFPSAVCYLGPNWPRFREVFGPLGDGYSRWAA